MSKGDIHIKLSKELEKEFERCLATNCQNKSKLIRRWIEDYIKEANAGKKN